MIVFLFSKRTMFSARGGTFPPYLYAFVQQERHDETKRYVWSVGLSIIIILSNEFLVYNVHQPNYIPMEYPLPESSGSGSSKKTDLTMHSQNDITAYTPFDVYIKCYCGLLQLNSHLFEYILIIQLEFSETSIASSKIVETKCYEQQKEKTTANFLIFGNMRKSIILSATTKHSFSPFCSFVHPFIS